MTHLVYNSNKKYNADIIRNGITVLKIANVKNFAYTDYNDILCISLIVHSDISLLMCPTSTYKIIIYSEEDRDIYENMSLITYYAGPNKVNKEYYYQLQFTSKVIQPQITAQYLREVKSKNLHKAEDKLVNTLLDNCLKQAQKGFSKLTYVSKDSVISDYVTNKLTDKGFNCIRDSYTKEGKPVLVIKWDED